MATGQVIESQHRFHNPDVPSEVLLVTNEGQDDSDVGENFLNPGGRDDVAWCRVYKESNKKDKELYGKWLVFKDYDQLNETWRVIVTAIREGVLKKCSFVKSSTLYYNPHKAGPGPSTCGVICVYTYNDDMDDIGYKLIQLVKQDIKYKTNEDTRKYHFAFVNVKSTIKTLYYNQGHPSTELTGERCNATTPNKEDIWHVNVVINSRMHNPDYGRWILTLEYRKLTHLWHLLKRKIESGEMNALRMVCPYRDKPVFFIYTSKEDEKSVGLILISVVCCNIEYEKKDGSPQFRTLFWNDGECAYEKVNRKGITKNWRTGEDM